MIFPFFSGIQINPTHLVLSSAEVKSIAECDLHYHCKKLGKTCSSPTMIMNAERLSCRSPVPSPPSPLPAFFHRERQPLGPGSSKRLRRIETEDKCFADS